MRTRRRPARLTRLILNGFLAGNEPLTGDLLEEFDSGRSQWWLLRQAAALEAEGRVAHVAAARWICCVRLASARSRT